MTWLDGVKAVYGEPRLAFGPTRMHDDAGRYERQGWVWFVGGKNHHIALNRWPGKDRDRWVVVIGAHCREVAGLELTIYSEPTDELMADCLALARFLTSSMVQEAS